MRCYRCACAKLQDIKSKFEKQREAIEKDCKSRIREMKRSTKEKRERSIITDQMKGERDIVLAELDKSFLASTQLLLDSYDGYMKNFAPAPKFLPVSVVLLVECKKLRVEKYIIKPTDCAKDVKAFVAEEFKKRNDPLLQFGRDVRLIIRK